MKDKLELLRALGITDAQIIAAVLGGSTSSAPTAPAAPHHMVGKVCIARCTGAGVHVGTVTAIDGHTVEFAPGSLRLWRWFAVGGRGALHGVAAFGLDHEKDLRVEAAPGGVRLTGVHELIETSAPAQATFKAVWP